MKQRILSIAAMVAAMLFAASCSKDDDTQNAPAPAPSTTEPTEPTEPKSETIAVPFSITVNQGNNSLTKAKLVEDGDKLVQKFVKGDELVITGKGLSTAEGEESVLKLDENDIDKESATFSGILYFVSTGEVEPNPPTPEKVIIAKEGIKVDPYIIGVDDPSIIGVDDPSISLTATLRNISDENWNKGVKQLAPVVEPSSDEVNAEYMFTHYGYLKAEFKYKEGVKPTITLCQYTALLEFDLDFTGAKVNVRTIDNSDPNNVTIVNTPITLGKDVTYVAVPDGAVVTSQMIDNGKPWTIDLDKEYEDANSATVWYTITRKTPENCIPALFSLSADKQVFFSKGNLQYNVTDGANPKWKFADNQYDYIGGTVEGTLIGNVAGSTNTNVDGPWIDLFGWGTWLNGENVLKPYETQTDKPKTYIWSGNSALGEDWFTLSKDEWMYLFNNDTRADKYGKGNVAGVNGIILFPDVWTYPDLTSSSTSAANFTTGKSAWSNTYTAEDWAKMEANGAVFLPASGYRLGAGVDDIGDCGYYWSSSSKGEDDAFDLYFDGGDVDWDLYVRSWGQSVRLVRPL